jgi:hypothetical protein
MSLLWKNAVHQVEVHRAVDDLGEDHGGSAAAYLAQNALHHPWGLGGAWHQDRSYAEDWANRGHQSGYVVSGTVEPHQIADPGEDVDGVAVTGPVRVTRVTHHPVSGEARDLQVEPGLEVES